MSDRTSIYHAELLFRAVNLCPTGHMWERGVAFPRHHRFAWCRGLRRNRCPADIPVLSHPCSLSHSIPLYLVPSSSLFYFVHHLSLYLASSPPISLSHSVPLSILPPPISLSHSVPLSILPHPSLSHSIPLTIPSPSHYPFLYMSYPPLVAFAVFTLLCGYLLFPIPLSRWCLRRG